MSDMQDLIHISARRAYDQGVLRERLRIHDEMIKLADRLNGESQANQIMYLYRFIEAHLKSARTHENQPNPRLTDPEKLDLRTNARKATQ